jgi:hypothetical protein
MITSSKYIMKTPQRGGKRKIELKKNLSAVNSKKLLHISAKSFLLTKQDCVTPSYNIENALQTDFVLIENKKPIKVFICVYRISNCNNNNTSWPFLEYLLYKYPTNVKKSNRNKMVFPFYISKGGENIQHKADKLCHKLTNKKLTTKGFIEISDNIYFFYHFIGDDYKNIKIVGSNNELWWAIMDEICNHRALLRFPIHKSVYTIFYENQSLIYLRDEKNNRMEIPVVGYTGGYSKLLPALALSIGDDGNTTRTFGSYQFGVRKGGWTDHFEIEKIDGEAITNKEGKYTKGGLVRFAIFLFQTNVVDTPHNSLEKYIKQPELWKKQFDSIYFGRIKNKQISPNIHFDIKNMNQKTPLSIHELDMETLRKWKPFSESYQIV